jgi:putative salt-induced outer membrane protein
MRNSYKTASIAALVIALSAPAFAQGVLVGITALDEEIEDITRETNKDLNRQNDAQRFGPLGVPQGWRGSIAVSANAVTGNSDTGDFALGGRLTYGVNKWTHSVGVASTYSRTGAVSTEEKFFATYEANRHFTEKFYVFGLGSYQFDGLAGPLDLEHEAFLGFGPGIRIVNTEQVAWRVQAGPGVRWTKTAGGVKNSEVAAIISSRFFYKLTDTLSITNDTDILGDKVTTSATNDLGLNFKISNNMSTRFSYRTDYDSVPGLLGKKYDNTLGLSLVVGF